MTVRVERNVEHLNLHHLKCFWLLARRGTLVAAARALHVTPSTVWVQVRALEEALELRLLEKRGRKLALTAEGERIAQIADELFELSQEVLDVAREGTSQGRTRIGISHAVPRFVSAQLLAPLMDRAHRLEISHGAHEALLGQLAGGDLDVILSDDARTGPVRAGARLIATSSVGLFCGARLHSRLSADFPRSLDQAPFVLPSKGTAQRTDIDDRLRELKVRPSVVCEVDDSALLKALAAEHGAVIAAPELVREELLEYFGLKELAPLETTVSYFLLSIRGRPAIALDQLTFRPRRRAGAPK